MVKQKEKGKDPKEVASYAAEIITKQTVPRTELG